MSTIWKIYAGKEKNLYLGVSGEGMKSNTDRFFVITGGPGGGKTSLIAALHQQGYGCTVEAGRAIIQEQAATGGKALPWDDRALFAELMLSWEIRSYHLAEESAGIVFFDRGVPDVLGYLRLVGLPVPGHMQKAAQLFGYYRSVFILPPWREIFSPDQERKQDFDEAIRTYAAMKAIYSELGYELIEIPPAPIEDRVQFVLHHALSS
jgi:predicted ATPase